MAQNAKVVEHDGLKEFGIGITHKRRRIQIAPRFNLKKREKKEGRLCIIEVGDHFETIYECDLPLRYTGLIQYVK